METLFEPFIKLLYLAQLYHKHIYPHWILAYVSNHIIYSILLIIHTQLFNET